MNPEPPDLRNQSAERFLQLVQERRRGRLKVYIGLAAGVGKTYRMLQEAHELLQHGIDVVLGLVVTHDRAGTKALLPGLPLVPRKQIFYKGRMLEEMDVQAILQRRPSVVVVDELAHTNVPGSRNEKRWQDVEQLVKAGISVITAVNVQHLESLHDHVQRITGTNVTERVPDQLLKLADEVVNVDLTVSELRGRLEEGKVYDLAKVPVALHNFFRAENLLQLRELALREVANLLGRQIENDAGDDASLKTRHRNADRLLACINSNAPAAQEIIRKTSRLADRLGGAPWYVLYVQTSREAPDRVGLATQRQLLHNLQLATELGGHILRIKAEEVVTGIMRVATEKNASLLICGATNEKRWWRRFTRRSITNDLIRRVTSRDIHLDLYLVAY